MRPLFAGASPMTFDVRLVAAIVGFGLVLSLSARLRGTPSGGRCVLLTGVVFLSLLGLELIGFRDRRGVVSFLIGVAGAVLVGRDASAASPAGGGLRAKWLALSAAPIGLGLGLLLFGAWYSQADEADRGETVRWAVTFTGVGLLAGTAVGAVVFVLAWGGSANPPSEPTPTDTPPS